ncbi:hypothetical protein PANO111632_19445 [Paracoccus nototheniae]|uniref:SGNH/GDSL hydrolase family protein n=1 Tax=Paracoccus nototheniae TaxID=2489002 RepID=A0ABW4DUL4_9RHOB|nr:hypothetical protein [Paracoccus nototheniae]
MTTAPDAAPDANTVYIVGGSNSLLTGGWSHQLADLAGPGLRVVNLSVGAATTLIGIYRLLAQEVPDGAVIVWEYALNEQNHFCHGQSAETLERHLDWFLELCARRSIKVVPLVCWNRAEMDQLDPGAYRRGLDQVLRTRGLQALDLHAGLIAYAGRKGLPVADFYSDNAHYRLGTGFPRWIAALVHHGLKTARVPLPQAAFQGLSLVLALPDRPADGVFSNRVLQAETFGLDQPLRIAARGRLLCCYLIATTSAGAIEVKADNARVGVYSAQSIKGPGQPERLMKHLVLWSGAGDCRQVQGQIVLRRAGWMTSPQVQNLFAWQRRSGEGPAEAILGVLIETRV